MKTRLLAVLACLLTLTTLNAQTVPTPDHVVVVIMENHGYSEIIGTGTGAPYINSLAVDSYAALFTNSLAITHPSQPNYLYLFSGSSQNVIGDLTPFSFLLPFTTANLGAELLAANKTFSGYSEDLPSPGLTGDTYGNYARKHAPWVNWQGTGTNGIPANLALPYDSFPSNYNSLPTLSFVIPNLQDDMHDGTIAQGDTWLQTHMDAYIQWAKTHNSLLILTYDEDENAIGNSTAIVTIFIGQMVKMGQYNESVDHNRVLRTMEDMYGLSYAGASSTPLPITDCWVYRPVSALNATPSTICPGQSVTMVDSSANSPTSWWWSFPGGSPANATGQTPPSIRYDTTGTYNVTLITYNHMGFDTLTKSAYITVSAPPVIALSSDSTAICQGDTASVVAYGASTYNWLPGSGIVSANNDNLLAAPSSTTTYYVTGSLNGCKADTAMATVVVNQSMVPAVSISANSALSVCHGGTIVQTATPVNGGSSPVYQWQVNGVNVGANSPTYSAVVDSNFSVQCTITSSAPCANPASAVSNVLNVTTGPPLTSVINSAICNGSTYAFNGQNLSAAGTYTQTLTASSGCDSIVTLNLTINPPLTHTIQAAVCSGRSYYFNNQSIIVSGTYYETLTTASGCDSMVTLNLTVAQTLTTTSNASICSGETYTFSGRVLTSAGTYYGDTLIAAGGCDSVAVLNLTVNPLPSVNWSSSADTVYANSGSILLTDATPSGGVFSGTGVSGNAFYPTSVAPGSYIVTYTYADSNGCINTANKTFVVISTGIDDLSAQAGLVLYPNPVKNELFIVSAGAGMLNELPGIFDVTGRHISAPVTKRADGLLIDTRALATGVYCIKVNVNGAGLVRKFVKAD